MSDDESKNLQRNVSNNDDEDSKYNKTPFEQAIPMDKLKNGLDTASQFFNWGYQNIKDTAKHVNEELDKSERVKDLRNRIEPTFKSINDNFNENVRPKLNESVQAVSENVTSLYEKSKPTFTGAYEKTKDGLGKAYEEAKKTVESINKPKDGH